MKLSRSGAVLALVASAAALAPATAAAAPLSAGPSIALPRLAPVDDLLGTAITARGDALFVSSPQPNCCRADQPLVARQRRGARGIFGAPVTILAGRALAGRPYGNVATALAPNGDALIALVGPGNALVTAIRRGWTGAWRAVSPPAGAKAVSLPVVASTPGGFQILWSDAAGSVRGARLERSAWRELAPMVPTPLRLTLAQAQTLDLALAPSGGALAVWGDAEGRIWASPRDAAGASWAAPAQLGAIAPSPIGPTYLSAVSAAIGRDGSLLAGWSGRPAGTSDPAHGWITRRRPGAPGWDPVRDLGPAGGVPQATTGRAGDLAILWQVGDPFSDEGPHFVQLLREAPGVAPAQPIRVPVSGSSTLSLDDQGGLTMVGSFGHNAATSGALLATQERRGAPVRPAASFHGRAAAWAVSAPYALLGTASPEETDRVVYRGADRLGPLGLVVPATARPGARLNVRLNLWTPARVSVRLRGGPARAQVTRQLPAGRSVVTLRLPRRAGAYLVQAAGRQRPKTPLLTQRAVVRAR